MVNLPVEYRIQTQTCKSLSAGERTDIKSMVGTVLISSNKHSKLFFIQIYIMILFN